MNEEIMRILKMVEEKKITAEQGAKLIEAVDNASTPSPWIDLNEPVKQVAFTDADDPAPSGAKPKWLYIMVDGGAQTHGKNKHVRVRIPIKLARWALKFVPKSAQAEMKKEYGEDFEFSQISEIIDELPVGEDLVNVVDEEGGETVRIFLR